MRDVGVLTTDISYFGRLIFPLFIHVLFNMRDVGVFNNGYFLFYDKFSVVETCAF